VTVAPLASTRHDSDADLGVTAVGASVESVGGESAEAEAGRA
jgi:hypothetical protein